MENESKRIDREIRISSESFVSTIPAEVIKVLNISPGDDIRFVIKADGKVEIEKSENQAKTAATSTEFTKTLNKGLLKYDEALKQLVEK